MFVAQMMGQSVMLASLYHRAKRYAVASTEISPRHLTKVSQPIQPPNFGVLITVVAEYPSNTLDHRLSERESHLSRIPSASLEVRSEVRRDDDFRAHRACHFPWAAEIDDKIIIGLPCLLDQPDIVPCVEDVFASALTRCLRGRRASGINAAHGSSCSRIKTNKSGLDAVRKSRSQPRPPYILSPPSFADLTDTSRTG